MLCSCDGVVSECEVTGDLQVDPDVALKLSYRPSRSGVSKQTSKPLFGVNKKPGLVLAKGVLEYRLMQMDIYRLATHAEPVWRAWRMIGVLCVVLVCVEKFSRVQFRLSV